jgi:hypothetical protein
MSLHGTSNENGTRLTNFAITHDMKICGTFFPHKKIHQATHESATAGKRQIDHMLIESRDFRSVLDIKSHRDASINYDHYLVRARIHQLLPKKSKTSTKDKTIKCNLEKLKDNAVAFDYQQCIDQKLKTVNKKETNVEIKWQNIKSAVQESALEILGEAPKKEKNKLFDKECEEKAKERKELKTRMNRKPTRRRLKEYQECNSETNRLFRQKKREHIRSCVSQIEDAS